MNKCDCCGRSDQKIAGVACSALGPFSLAYCTSCAFNYAEPKAMILDLIEECGGLKGIREELTNVITYFEDGQYKKMSEL